MKQLTPIEELVPVLRQWERDWDMYDNGFTLKKPISIDEVLSPFLEKEKQVIVDAYTQGLYLNFDHCELTPEHYAETYFNNKYSK